MNSSGGRASTKELLDRSQLVPDTIQFRPRGVVQILEREPGTPGREPPPGEEMLEGSDPTVALDRAAQAVDPRLGRGSFTGSGAVATLPDREEANRINVRERRDEPVRSHLPCLQRHRVAG